MIFSNEILFLTSTVEWTPKFDKEYVKYPAPKPYDYTMGQQFCAEAGGILPQPLSRDDEFNLRIVLVSRPLAKYYALGMEYLDPFWVWRSNDAWVNYFNWMNNYPQPNREYVWYDVRFDGWNNQPLTSYGNANDDLAILCQRQGKSVLIV